MDKSTFIARTQRARKVEPVTITGLDDAHVRLLTLGERERMEKAVFGVASDEGRTISTLLAFGLCDAAGVPFLKESEFDALAGLDAAEAKEAKEVFVTLNKRLSEKQVGRKMM